MTPAATATEPALTPRQTEILRFFWRHLRRMACFPSVREIGAHFGIRSPNGVRGHLQALAAKGYLLPPPDGWRNLARGWRLAGVRVEIEEGGAGDRLRRELQLGDSP